MALNNKQKKQIEKQLKAHAIPWKYTIDVPRGAENPILHDLVMYPGVLQPLSSGHFGRFLHDNPELYKDKLVLDMGCGSGALGVIMALRGAKKVILADIDKNCCNNTLENLSRFGVESKCEVVQSDLFEKLSNVFDLIIFAHPYFGFPPVLPAFPVTRGMLDDGQLIHRFLDTARLYLNGSVLMPYLQLAGETNNPAVQGSKHGYEIEILEEQNLKVGYQRGAYTVYRLFDKSKQDT